MLESLLNVSYKSRTGLRVAVPCILLAVLTLSSASVAVGVEQSAFDAGVQIVEEYQAPGLAMELSGIYPHPSDTELYYVLANKQPVYDAGQKPMLDAEHRGKLLLVNRSGEVVDSEPLAVGDYGGLAYGEGHFFVSSLEPAEILKVDAANGDVVARFPIAGPAGGLEYDADKKLIYAQLFVGYPHLAVIDPESGATVDTLWSDESAMGLAKVDGDLLCTWSNGLKPGAISELRLIDQESGKVKARLPLDKIHTSMAPVADGFMSLVATGDEGETVVRKYAYNSSSVAW